MQADAHISAARIDSPRLNMSADGRWDSPGHCALYCIVTFFAGGDKSDFCHRSCQGICCANPGEIFPSDAGTIP
mgnify:CR=1 FL=1